MELLLSGFILRVKVLDLRSVLLKNLKLLGDKQKESSPTEGDLRVDSVLSIDKVIISCEALAGSHEQDQV
jgi:hypothetical protein